MEMCYFYDYTAKICPRCTITRYREELFLCILEMEFFWGVSFEN